ncbi:zinc-binding dehydrogenase [Rhodococcus sp. NPDC127593]|uniref:zinc-binding dehydrogenase n=1 Tax=Rhodococcus sp. NPDC127593 TaxID=3345404 RepID=UPI00363A4727
MICPTMVATCTTDVHLIETAAFPAALGKVVGHEAVGVVERVGESVVDFAAGDRVIIPTGFSDWRHPAAQRGEAKYHQTNSPYFSEDADNAGTFSEFVKTLDADQNLALIPDSVTDQQAVMVPAMMSTGFSGVERMNIEFGDTVLVLGIGPVGLLGVAGAALRGAGRIIAVGSRPKTVELARFYGATDIIDYKQGDVAAQVLALTGGKPVDSVLVASGGSATGAFTTALTAVKFGGHVDCVAVFFDDKDVRIPMEFLNFGVMEKFITEVLVKDGREYLGRLLVLIENGKIDTAPLVSHVLDEWSELENGMALMRSRDTSVIKPVVKTPGCSATSGAVRRELAISLWWKSTGTRAACCPTWRTRMCRSC